MSGDSLFIRLYLDEDFHPDLAASVRKHGCDCVSTVEAGRLEKSDEEQLIYAAAQGRCVISFNIGDFADLAILWSRTGRDHAGIVVAQQVSRRHLGRLLHRLLHLLNTVTADEMANTFRYLPD
jgi:predicted nuclease of predicted toxin-antitoxin system